MAALRSASPGAVVLAAAFPPLFLHVEWQPSVSFGLGGASVDVSLADLAVLTVAATAVAVGLRSGFAPLGRARIAWITLGALLAAIALATVYGALREDTYPFATHAVTAAKFAEYALLAPAVPLLIRRRADLELFLGAVVAWSVLATLFATLQFFELAPTLDDTPGGRRKHSFLTYHDFGAFSAAVLGLGLIAIVVSQRRRLFAVAGIAGGLGVVLAAAIDVVLGLVLAAAALVLVARRRGLLTPRLLVAAATVVGVVTLGVLAVRSGDVDQYLRFVGAREEEPETTGEIQSWAQRTLLLYIGGRIFLDHPILGVGWQASAEQPSYAPYLDDAHKRFDQPERAFPSPQNRWGVQNAYVQALADMGLVGFAVFVAVFVAGVVVALRAIGAGTPDAALVGLAWLLVAAGVWNGFGLVAGISLDALTWLGLGLAATRVRA